MGSETGCFSGNALLAGLFLDYVGLSAQRSEYCIKATLVIARLPIAAAAAAAAAFKGRNQMPAAYITCTCCSQSVPMRKRQETCQAV